MRGADLLGPRDTASAASRPWPLATLPWSKLLARCFVLWIAESLLSRHLPAPLTPHLANRAADLVVIGALLLRYAADLRRAPQRLARGRARGRSLPLAAAMACLPAGLVGLARVAAGTVAGFAGWLTRRAPSPRPAGIAIGYLRRSSYGALLPLAVLSSIGEIPVTALLLGSIAHGAAERHGIELVMAIAMVLSFVALLGDRWLLKHGGHVVTAHALDLQVAARAAGGLPRAAILRVVPSRKPRDAARDVGLRDVDIAIVSPMDGPNVLLLLAPGTPGHWRQGGVERPWPRALLLYVDDPDALVRALAPTTVDNPAP